MFKKPDVHYGRKRSGIKRELKAKIEDWVSSITDEEVKKAVLNDVIVTGGAIASMLLGEKINDFDLYFRTKETTKLVAEYYVNKFKENHKIKVKEGVAEYTPEVHEESLTNVKGDIEERVVIYIKSAGVVAEEQTTYGYFESLSEDETKDFAESLINDVTEDEDNKYRPVFMSENAITLSNSVQLVVRFYGEPDQIHNNYDFVHAKCYWDHKNQNLVLPAESLEALLSRTLIYQGSLYPIASIFRMKKFLTRGWRITAGQQLKIMWQISEIDLTDPVVMKEQLTGVDQAYMYELIQALKDIEIDKINSTYVALIIDKIFD